MYTIAILIIIAVAIGLIYKYKTKNNTTCSSVCVNGSTCVNGICTGGSCNPACPSGTTCNTTSGTCSTDLCANVTCAAGIVCDQTTGKCPCPVNCSGNGTCNPNGTCTCNTGYLEPNCIPKPQPSTPSSVPPSSSTCKYTSPIPADYLTDQSVWDMYHSGAIQPGYDNMVYDSATKTLSIPHLLNPTTQPVTVDDTSLTSFGSVKFTFIKSDAGFINTCPVFKALNDIYLQRR